MARVKGTVLTVINDFVKAKHPEHFTTWKNSLPKASKALYDSNIMATEWYDADVAVTDPTIALAEVAYDGDIKKASWECGKFSAQVSLTGIYKVFILISTPHFLIKRGARILSSFYEPSKMRTQNDKEKYTEFFIEAMPGISEVIEYRIAAWVEQAFTICGCSNIKFEFVSQLSKGDGETMYRINWE